jgi:hypothetical protein
MVDYSTKLLFSAPTVRSKEEPEVNLDSFEPLTNKVGGGAFGEVFKALCKLNQKVYAIKRISKKLIYQLDSKN